MNFSPNHLLLAAYLPLSHSLGAATLYLEEQQFLDAVAAPPQVESFENLGAVSTTQELDFGSIVVSNRDNRNPGLWSVNDEQRSLFPSEGELYIQYGGGWNETLSFQFDFPITAFGIHLFDYGDETNTPLDFVPNRGETLSWLPNFAPDERFFQFVGYVSDEPFTSIGLRQNSVESYLLDEALFLPVPEPSSILLLLSTSAIFMQRRRRENR